MPRNSRLLVALLALAGVALVVGCGSDDDTRDWPEGALRPTVIDTFPHDPTRFTQGLEIADEVLYEGTGMPGESRLVATALTGERPGAELRAVDLPAPIFGEGITVVGPRIWQLTWTDGFAIERDRETLRELRRVNYDGEGWGLCLDGGRLVMSNGSGRLTFRDPDTFEPTGGVDVELDGKGVEGLNELECVDGQVWANVFDTDVIVRIDPADGRVTAVVDAGGLLSPAEQSGASILNGIAAIPGSDEFLITGKYWPTVFRVRFEASGT